MKRIVSTVSLFAILILGSACANVSGGIAPSNVPLAPGSYSVLGDTHGKSCVTRLFGVLPLSGSNTTSNAVENALKRKKGATALINITSDSYNTYWLIVTRSCIRVEATAVSHN